MTEIFMTLAERKTKELHDNLARDYQEMKAKNPDVSNHRICIVLAEAYGLTAGGIRNLLDKDNVLIKKKRDNDND